MVMRIEDLDPRGHNPQAAQILMDDLLWLGLDWDEGPYYQSQRHEVYEQAIERLTERGLTYPCFCTRAELHAATAPHASDGTYIYQGTCRSLTPAQVAERRALRNPAVRIRVPDADDPSGTIRLFDLGYGWHEETLAVDCGDFLLRRSDGVIAYQLAVVVDDTEMGVTQVVRGRDLLGSAARQTWLATMLEHEAPTFGHVPLLMSPDGRRLSKRDKDLDLGVLRERFKTPEPLVGMLAHAVGLAEKGECVSAAELIPRFSWDIVRAHNGDITVADGMLV